MGFDYKKMVKALSDVEDQRNIPMNVIVEALKEAMVKAYKKDSELLDIDVVAEINEKNKTIDLYQNYEVVEEVEDDEMEISLEDAKEFKEDAVLGDTIKRKIDMSINDMSRAASTLARNVIRQKIREAEKIAVYDEYIGQLHEMVLGIVESVKDKFTLVNLGKTVAMMPRSAEIPGEILKEGQKLRVVITEVNKETKGSQVLVSRADAMLVKRLFEKEVPEIFQGTVEIKAIAREAGERTKMAVVSHNPEVDPIGACIGPRGSRVQEIIDELHGEKIDIFEYSDDITKLVENALAPAEIIAVIPTENDNELMVVVDEKQQSLAIGKYGKNARLAVRLTGKKIDIKKQSDIEEMGLDFEQLLKDAEVRREELRKQAEAAEIERLKAEALAAEERRLEAVAKLAAETAEEREEQLANEDVLPEEMQEAMQDKIRYEMAMEPEKEEKVEEKTVVEETTEEPVEEEKVEEATVEEEVVEEIEEEVEEDANVDKSEKRKHADLEEMASKNTYVSKFEKLTETASPKQSDKPKRKKKKSDDDDYKLRNKDLEKQIKENLNTVENRPIYTEEELAEIEAAQLEEEEREYDIDYDDYEDYDDYYDDEDNN